MCRVDEMDTTMGTREALWGPTHAARRDEDGVVPDNPSVRRIQKEDLPQSLAGTAG